MISVGPSLALVEGRASLNGAHNEACVLPKGKVYLMTVKENAAKLDAILNVLGPLAERVAKLEEGDAPAPAKKPRTVKATAKVEGFVVKRSEFRPTDKNGSEGAAIPMLGIAPPKGQKMASRWSAGTGMGPGKWSLVYAIAKSPKLLGAVEKYLRECNVSVEDLANMSAPIAFETE